MIFNKSDLMQLRLNHSLVADKKEDIHSILSHVLGVQAQYPNYAKINIINRLDKSAFSTFHDALDHPEAILAWGQRRTVHFYNMKDWLDLSDLFKDEAKWPDKHLHKNGYFPDDELNRLKSLFENQNPLKKEVLQDYYKEEWKVLFHWSSLFLKASTSGQLYFKLSGKDKHYYWNRLEESDAVSKFNLELKLLRQYFNAYGPATKRDAAHFFGVKQSFFTVPFETYFNVMNIDGETYFHTGLSDSVNPPEVVLLGKFDPLLLAYKDKGWIVSKDDESEIWRKAAQVEAVLLVNQQFAGTWRYKVRGSKVDFNIFLNQQVNKSIKKKISSQLEPFAFALDKEYGEVYFIE